jgi:uncharacterized protein (TIGR02217 family)
MSFLETPRFPDVPAAWMTGGRGWMTTVVRTYGGNEYRNAAWQQPLGEWQIQNAWASATPAAYAAAFNVGQFVKFMRVNQGMFNGFRIKDFTDYQDEGGGIFVSLGGGLSQMYKAITLGAITFNQIVNKPVSPIAITGGGSLDYTTGIVTGGSPTAWTGTYDIPARFATDAMDVGLDESSGALYNWQSLKLTEIRNP